MTLTQLRYIIAIVDTGSMNEAAKSLFISQPSLSLAVKELEKEIGTRLFKRSNRGVSVTQEGMDRSLNSISLWNLAILRRKISRRNSEFPCSIIHLQ